MDRSSARDGAASQSAGGEMEESLPALPRDRYDLRILSALRRIIRSVDSHSRRLASDFGVTVPQLLCMLKIAERGSMTVKELSGEVFLAPSTVVGIVDRLEKAQLFLRERSAEDRRQVRLSLTDQGRELLARSPSPLQANLVEAIGRLPELERATIALSLERIIECIGAPSHPAAEAAPGDGTAPVLESSPDLNESNGVPPLL